MRRILGPIVLVCSLLPALASGIDYIHFESGPVRALAASPDGSQLFATNISDSRLEIFDIGVSGPVHWTSVPVGLEPVAVAARTNSEVWVVNHLSDSVSIVDVGSTPPRVVRTLLVGDEPRDIVFAGPGGNRAFITTARRGQNSQLDPMLTTGGIGRANVWVFDALSLGSEPGGAPIAVLTLFGDTPRALAASPDGSRVYAAVFHSGNQTVGLDDLLTHPVEEALKGITPEILLEPNTNIDGDIAPIVGRIVKFDPNQGAFLDVAGVSWSAFIPFDLPDRDVFAIDANATPPVEVADFQHVGTILFNMAVNPANGKVYVTNSEARNEVRFEGPGIFGGSTVRGRLHEYRITVIDPNSGSVVRRHLNKHIDYSLTPAATVAAGFRDHSLATPLDMVIRSDGSKLYVAAFGSRKVGVFTPSEIEGDSFTPSESDHIEISGEGPGGLVLDEVHDLLYVYSRFANEISVVDVSTHPGTEIAVLPLAHSPESPTIQDGRKFFYDARLTSSNGEASCSSCHIFARMDDLAWDLGNPDGSVQQNNNVQSLIPLELLMLFLNPPEGFVLEHHPMKGPMLTQSLRGLDKAGPMHWRGDRSGGTFREDPASLDEDLAFKAFNVAFEGLLGRTGPLTTANMQTFTSFILKIPYPPNPIRNLDNSLTPSQANGRVMFSVVPTDAGSPGDPQFTCERCHALDVAAGFFGTDGLSSFDGATQIFKIPHLRNVYQRVGMFGQPQGPTTLVPTGDQIRGYGYLHDGFVDSLFTFVGGDTGGSVFQFPGATAAERIQNRRDVEAFMLAFDTNMLPILGQQVTLGAGDPLAPIVPGGSETADQRLDLMIARASVSSPRRECVPIAKGVVGGVPRGWKRRASGDWQDDSGGTISEVALRALAGPGQEITFTCLYNFPGGKRFGVDRDQDGIFNGEQCGDVNGDGVAGRTDAEHLRLELAELFSVLAPEKCNVIGTAGGGPGTCTIQDVVAIARKGAELGPGLSQLCPAAAL